MSKCIELLGKRFTRCVSKRYYIVCFVCLCVCVQVSMSTAQFHSHRTHKILEHINVVQNTNGLQSTTSEGVEKIEHIIIQKRKKKYNHKTGKLWHNKHTAYAESERNTTIYLLRTWKKKKSMRRENLDQPFQFTIQLHNQQPTTYIVSCHTYYFMW